MPEMGGNIAEESNSVDDEEDPCDDVGEACSTDDDSLPIIVLHPGSKWLRLGLATTPEPGPIAAEVTAGGGPHVPSINQHPKTVLHAVARLRTKAALADKKLQRRDPYLVSPAKPDPVSHRKLVEARTRVAKMLANTLTSSGRRRFVESQSVVSQINADKKPHKLPINDLNRNTEDDKEKIKQSLYGHEILDAMDSLESPYNVRFPLKRGDLDLDPSKVYGSESSTLTDIEDIWTNAIESELGIPRRDFSRHRVVLVIPAVHRRGLVKHFMTLLLNSMGFAGAFVSIDHVCAAFGAGLSHCCVVDVGDQKTSVSCVEDGISLPQTRIHLDYGGSDITQVFHFLLRQSNFPYKDCRPGSVAGDAALLDRLKTDNCHMDLDICGTAEKAFDVKKNGSTVRYSVCLSDECVIAPMAFYHPELFQVTAPPTNAPFNRTRLFERNEGDPEDPHDDLVDTVTPRRLPLLKTPLDQSMGDNDESEVSVTDSMDQLSPTAALQGPPSSNSTTDKVNVTALDAAILRSVEQCPTDELRRRALGSVLLVGHGLSFPGSASYLKQRLALQIPGTSLGLDGASVDVITDAKDSGSEVTTWKGAAVMASMHSASELWIQPSEWNKAGLRLLREKAPFPWT